MYARQLDRRDFLKITTLAGSGLTLGVVLPGCAAPAPPAAPLSMPFVRIDPDNTVTVFSKHLEAGQGVWTGLPAIVAEELDAAWGQMRVESAPAQVPLYQNLAFVPLGVHAQFTGGSTAVANSWQQLREAGASARALLVSAAARQWHVAESQLRVERSVIYHDASKRQATFGSLVKIASALPMPAQVALKDPRRFTLIGTRPPRVDVPAKCDGTAQFSLDVVMPDLLVALLARPSLFGATVASFDPAHALAVPGVVKVVQVPRGVAVLAKSFWAAKKGRDKLVIQWDDTHAE